MPDITITYKEKSSPERTALVLATDPTLSLDAIVALLVEFWNLPVEKGGRPIGYGLEQNKRRVELALTLADLEKQKEAAFQMVTIPNFLVIADFSQSAGLEALQVKCEPAARHVTLVVEPEQTSVSALQSRLETFWKLPDVFKDEPVYYSLQAKGQPVPCEKLVSEIPLSVLDSFELIREVGLKFLADPEDITQNSEQDGIGEDDKADWAEIDDGMVQVAQDAPEREATPSISQPNQQKTGLSGDIGQQVDSVRNQFVLPSQELTYLDFDLQVAEKGYGIYQIQVLNSPAGQSSEELAFPFTPAELETRLDKLQIALLSSGGGRRRVAPLEEQIIQGFGCALFNFLFHGEIRSRYYVSRERARNEAKGLRLRLRVQAPELAVLPWEFMYDDRSAQYICRSSQTPLVRYPEVPQPALPLSIKPPLRILSIISSPRDLTPLDVEREKQLMNTSLASLLQSGLVQLNWVENPTWRKLQQTMWGGTWHIIHFIGHGGYSEVDEEGFICLVDEDGRRDDFIASHLAEMLADHPASRLVVLNACEGGRGSLRDIFSSTAAVLIRFGLPAVLAMQSAITDKAAIEFSQTLYTCLAYGMGLETAVTEARRAINMSQKRSLEWGIPVLYLRAPTGQLFDLKS